MCGICGCLTINRAIDVERGTRSMLAALRHRGPDGEGCRYFGSGPARIALGNTRLAIIDLSEAGRQPMSNEDGTIWVVFNGEIVNFRELRAELVAAGYRFHSNTDTEVIVHAYEAWGPACVDKLQGMFAFAIYDSRPPAPQHPTSPVLLLARDPLGIKPLYYYQSNQCLLFASEVRTLLASDMVPRRLSLGSLWTYLGFGSVQEPLTIVEGIFALPPGTVLTVPLHDEYLAVTCRHYFQFPTGHTGPGNGAVSVPSSSAWEALLAETVRKWLISDVPLGIFLSGGIDSASVLALARVALGEDASLRTFTIAFQEEAFNEAPIARRTAQQFAADHTEVLVTPAEALARLPEAIAAMDQPTMDGINTYLVANAARAAGLTVALSGLGGDEVFGGYSTFRTVPRLAQWHHTTTQLPHLLRQGIGALAAFLPMAPDARSKVASLLAGQSYIPNDTYAATLPYLFARAVLTPAAIENLLAPLDSVGPDRWCERVGEVWQEAKGHDPVNTIAVLELRHYLLNTLLRDTDCMSMAHGLEVRPPLLDHTVVTQVLQLPGPAKLDNRIPKPLLVHAVGTLPEEVVQRRKTTFTFPWQAWLRTTLRTEVEQTLQQMDDVLPSVLEDQAVHQVWNDFLSGRTSWSRVWTLVVLAKWVACNGVST